MRAYLAPLEVGTLRARPELAELPEVLECLGVCTLGELAALPVPSISERFGHPGLLALALALPLAHGRDTPLAPRRSSEPVASGSICPRPFRDRSSSAPSRCSWRGCSPAPSVAGAPCARSRSRHASSREGCATRAVAGEGAALRALEVDPDSRVPERRAVLAPFSAEREPGSRAGGDGRTQGGVR